VSQIAKRRFSESGGEQTVLSEDEVMNLCIRRGTLNDADRKIINDHIVVTIQMLESLPFPKMLKRVPQIAGGHHEKMDGTGYPKGLKREDMSVTARMMGIADIFEALTAADRPYKAPKTLSDSIKIMGFMKKDQHIDAELFELFLRSGVYRQYAERFLLPEQIDEIDVEKVLGAPAKTAAE
jgi:HD-GYP domain-containing protein (c-di-GMP phosphodiesterase class II)